MKWLILGLNIVIRLIFLNYCGGLWKNSLCLSISLNSPMLWRMSRKWYCLARKNLLMLLRMSRKGYCLARKNLQMLLRMSRKGYCLARRNLKRMEASLKKMPSFEQMRLWHRNWPHMIDCSICQWYKLLCEQNALSLSILCKFLKKCGLHRGQYCHRGSWLTWWRYLKWKWYYCVDFLCG